MKAEEILVLDVSDVSPITEYFVFATGTNPRHVKALASEAVATLKEGGIRPRAADGLDQGFWAVVDYGPVVVHVFQPEARTFYDLEMLWGDGKKVRWAEPKPRAAKDGEPGDTD